MNDTHYHYNIYVTAFNNHNRSVGNYEIHRRRQRRQQKHTNECRAPGCTARTPTPYAWACSPHYYNTPEAIREERDIERRIKLFIDYWKDRAVPERTP